MKNIDKIVSVRMALMNAENNLGKFMRLNADKYGKPYGLRWNGFEYVNWRKEKKRKRKLLLLNCKVRRGKHVPR